MSLFTGGSTLSLLAHELRLTWRARTKGMKSRWWRWVLILGAIGAFAVGLGWLVVEALRAADVTATPQVVVYVDLGLIALWTLMLSQTVTMAAAVFYDRGDLDLLLSSPVPPQRILTMRCVGMAVMSAIFFMLVVTPAVVAAVVIGEFKWLTVYPVLMALALLATAVGLSIAMALFRILGPRRTKTLAQIMGTLIGAGIFVFAQLFTQGRRYLPPAQMKALAKQATDLAGSGAFSGDQPATWPARAVLGEPIPALALFLVALVIFVMVTRVLGRRFSQDAAAAAGLAPRRARVSRDGAIKGFNSGPFAATLRKELKLLARDPSLISQVLLRVLYIILPLALALWSLTGAQSQYNPPRIAAALVFLTGQLAGSLCWVMISAEDALELLACAPVEASLLRRAKLTGAMLPVVGILIVPLAALTYLSPWTGAITAVGCAVSALSACLIAIWYEKPSRRNEFRRRRGGSFIGAVAELATGLCWSMATSFAALHWVWWAALPAAVGFILLIALRRPERSYTDTLLAAQS